MEKAQGYKVQGSDAFFMPFFVRRPAGAIFLPSAPVALLSLEMFTYNSQIILYKTLDKFEAQVYDIRVKEGKAVYA